MALTFDFTARDLIREGRTNRTVINEVHHWLPSQNYPDLPDQMIVLFLVAFNNSIDLTQKAIRTTFEVTNKSPELFNNRDMAHPDMIRVSRTIYSAVIPERTETDDIILFTKFRDTNYKHFNMMQATKFFFMFGALLFRQKPPHGYISVVDMDGIGLMHITRLDFKVMKVSSDMNDALPTSSQMKAMHILNANFVFYKLFPIIKPFMPKDVISRLHVHPKGMDMKDFYKCCVAAKYLPREYGGQMPSLEELNQRTVRKLQDLKPFFDAEEQLRKKVIIPDKVSVSSGSFFGKIFGRP